MVALGRRLGLVLVLSGLAACGGGGHPADGGDDLSAVSGDLSFTPVDAALIDLGNADATGVCTLIFNSAKAVASVEAQGSFPTQAGGAIADGVYFLTALQRYPTSTLPDTTMRRTIRISSAPTMSGVATTVEDVIETSSGETRSRYAASAGGGGQVMLSSVDCDEPQSVISTFGYTVAGRNLVLLDSGLQVTYTFELQ